MRRLVRWRSINISLITAFMANLPRFRIVIRATKKRKKKPSYFMIHDPKGVVVGVDAYHPRQFCV
jgi:hypothetical protein